MKSRDDHSHLVPAMVGKGRCADRQAGTLGPRQTHELYGSVARGPQPARGGRRCQEPLECPTLATLADALEAIGVNGCRPGWAADCRRSLASVNSAGAGLTGLTLVLGSVGVDSQDIQVYCRT